ncbi:hypothetical protein F4802DRAFT_579363 [Xylaria palmicola]|nr:hypothetical protein F4802DRAFT_579363 [Xylaria palmicola]
MSRKGFEKVRSGCTTCKARKVKCDEGRPQCQRCRSSGRACGGYRTPPIGSFSWNDLLQVRPSTLPDSASSSTELRGLDFFRSVVAPALESPLTTSFWARRVSQLAIREPSTRHAVLAISSLYERFDPIARISPFSDDGIVAIRHYNKALRQVATANNLDADTALLTSILFTCIEFLRGNTVAAIEHCRHGTHILRSTGQVSPETSAVLHHLSIFPFFFGATLTDFPPLRNLENRPRDMLNLADAMEQLDCIMSNSVRLLRAFDSCRLGATDGAGTLSSLTMLQAELCRGLDTWHAGFTALIKGLRPSTENYSVIRLLEIRWHVCHIWVNIASEQDEMSCDRFQDQFARMVELAQEDIASRKLLRARGPATFKFEMGLSPLLHFVVLKCRFLKIRLAALRLLETYDCARESCWDAALMYAIGRRFIEREHGIQLPPRLAGVDLELFCSDSTLPSDRERIRDSYLEDESQSHVDCDGVRMTQRRIRFFMQDAVLGKVRTVRDWIYLPEKS